ncbi:MAG: rhodanese-like domain-containing protein [Thermus sp.]|uniref:rhodanese-like domain-containing protein n=1 Tax=Thermus sp. TaxID=275 RepID=UPI0025F49B63|nr:rhodanese-like domain-containing protein [Thermus sp.]MCS6868657.1 rhodanese-like domain-containing protein [Thermus sp.]MCS7217968.1 rhodanese-like domain-containing protein [Thermus sp.]MDW8017829.1 rhodanese-like domain-containing protein [Thermus sp.]MDW8357041.1 rhodanese-like domain-containing protein [Thermus sp.]
MRRRHLLALLPLLPLARAQGGEGWVQAFGAFLQRVPPASYLVYPTEAKDLLLFEPFVLDVRTLEERKRGYIPGSVHIYAGQVPDRLSELPKDKEALILVYCNSGSVSMVVAAYLQALGYKNAKNIAHGFKGWLDAGLEVEGGS